MHFGVDFENFALIPNAYIEELKKVNYMNKRPFNFRVFKNKFAFARNTQKLRWFANT